MIHMCISKRSSLRSVSSLPRREGQGREGSAVCSGHAASDLSDGRLELCYHVGKQGKMLQGRPRVPGSVVAKEETGAVGARWRSP